MNIGENINAIGAQYVYQAMTSNELPIEGLELVRGELTTKERQTVWSKMDSSERNNWYSRQPSAFAKWSLLIETETNLEIVGKLMALCYADTDACQDHF